MVASLELLLPDVNTVIKPGESISRCNVDSFFFFVIHLPVNMFLQLLPDGAVGKIT